MFIVRSKTITNDKTLDIGSERQVTLSFQIQNGTDFADTDTFVLTYGGSYTNTNYSFTNDRKLKFVNVDFSFIENQETSVAIVVKKNGNTFIVNDTITVYAEVAGGSTDLSDYYTKEQTNSLVNDNGIAINYITQTGGTVTLPYNASYGIQRVDITGTGGTLAFKSPSGYTPVEGKIPTFEMWIKCATARTTITYNSAITLIDADNFPEQIETDTVYVYTWRFVGTKKFLNYSYKFAEASV